MPDVRLKGKMKTRREFLSVLRDYDTWVDFSRPDFLQELNHLADASFTKGTVEGHLAALLIYHQLCEELLRVLIDKSHFLLQCSVFPQRMEDRQLPKRMMFGELLREYERTLQLDESPELVKKCRQLNQIRVNMVHKITLKSTVVSISRQTGRCKVLFDDIWQLFDTILDNLRGGIGDYRKEIEEWEEWVEELEPPPKKSRPKQSTRNTK
jgi:hypothetical protein